jgi:predicted PurR-regulated permease PerM
MGVTEPGLTWAWPRRSSCLERVLVWIIIAGFFAVAVYPVVSWIERHLPWCRRPLATLLVDLLVVVIAGLVTLFSVICGAATGPAARLVPQGQGHYAPSGRVCMPTAAGTPG